MYMEGRKETGRPRRQRDCVERDGRERENLTIDEYGDREQWRQMMKNSDPVIQTNKKTSKQEKLRRKIKNL